MTEKVLELQNVRVVVFDDATLHIWVDSGTIIEPVNLPAGVAIFGAGLTGTG